MENHYRNTIVVIIMTMVKRWILKKPEKKRAKEAFTQIKWSILRP